MSWCLTVRGFVVGRGAPGIAQSVQSVRSAASGYSRAESVQSTPVGGYAYQQQQQGYRPPQQPQVGWQRGPQAAGWGGGVPEPEPHSGGETDTVCCLIILRF